MTKKEREALRATARVLRAVAAIREAINGLAPDIGGKINLPRVDQVLREETTALQKLHKRLETKAASEILDAPTRAALTLHTASIGKEKLRGQAIVITEGANDTPAAQSAALVAIEEELHEASHFWGNDANAIIIVGAEENEHHTNTLIAASVMADDDFPHPGLLVDETRSGVATTVFQGTSDMEIGKRVEYTISKPHNRTAAG